MLNGGRLIAMVEFGDDAPHTVLCPTGYVALGGGMRSELCYRARMTDLRPPASRRRWTSTSTARMLWSAAIAQHLLAYFSFWVRLAIPTWSPIAMLVPVLLHSESLVDVGLCSFFFAFASTAFGSPAGAGCFGCLLPTGSRLSGWCVALPPPLGWPS